MAETPAERPTAPAEKKSDTKTPPPARVNPPVHVNLPPTQAW